MKRLYQWRLLGNHWQTGSKDDQSEMRINDKSVPCGDMVRKLRDDFVQRIKS